MSPPNEATLCGLPLELKQQIYLEQFSQPTRKNLGLWDDGDGYNLPGPGSLNTVCRTVNQDIQSYSAISRAAKAAHWRATDFSQHKNPYQPHWRNPCVRGKFATPQNELSICLQDVFSKNMRMPFRYLWLKVRFSSIDMMARPGFGRILHFWSMTLHASKTVGTDTEKPEIVPLCHIKIEDGRVTVDQGDSTRRYRVTIREQARILFEVWERAVRDAEYMSPAERKFQDLLSSALRGAIIELLLKRPSKHELSWATVRSWCLRQRAVDPAKDPRRYAVRCQRSNSMKNWIERRRKAGRKV